MIEPRVFGTTETTQLGFQAWLHLANVFDLEGFRSGRTEIQLETHAKRLHRESAKSWARKHSLACTALSPARPGFDSPLVALLLPSIRELESWHVDRPGFIPPSQRQKSARKDPQHSVLKATGSASCVRAALNPASLQNFEQRVRPQMKMAHVEFFVKAFKQVVLRFEPGPFHKNHGEA